MLKHPETLELLCTMYIYYIKLEERGLSQSHSQVQSYTVTKSQRIVKKTKECKKDKNGNRSTLLYDPLSQTAVMSLAVVHHASHGSTKQNTQLKDGLR